MSGKFACLSETSEKPSFLRSAKLLWPVLLTAACFSLSYLAQGQDSVKIRVVTESDSDFAGLLTMYFPGLSSLPDYPERLPTLALIVNDSVLAAPAYSVEWVAQTPDGDTQVIAKSMFLTKLSVPRDVNPTLNVGDVRLISPLFNLSPGEYKSNKDFPAFYKASLLPQFVPGAHVSVVVDGAIMRDGTVAGVHADKLYSHYKASRSADHDEAIEILAALDAPSYSFLTTDRLSALLQSDAERASLHSRTEPPSFITYRSDPSTSDLAPRTLYLLARRESAMNYLALLQNEGSAKLRERLERIANFAPTKQLTGMARWF